MDEFSKWMFEAPGDPPDLDMGSDQGNDIPPDIGGDDGGGMDDSPPDLNMDDIGSGDNMGDQSFGDDSFGDDSGFGMNDEDGGENEGEEDQNSSEKLNLPEKISAIMNNQLYQRYLSMLNSIGNQISQMSNNGDVLFSLMKDGYTELLNKFEKLDENVRLWMKNSFINSDYSKNLLFFNMCLNLLNLLNNSFDEKVKKGLKEHSAE